MKLVVTPKYEHLTAHLRQIPEGSVRVEQVYKKNRNLVTRVSLEGIDLVVKQFKVPGWLNRIIYSWLRHSKARRSFDYAKKLLSIGIDTAEPVAYIEIRKKGLFHTGYYVSKFIDDTLLAKIEGCDEQTRARIIHDFAQFTVDMHLRRVFHKDYNCGNIFFRKEGEHYHFSLIDINRMRFRLPNKNNVIDSFDRLTLGRLTTVEISAEYAELRGWNADTLSGSVLVRKGMNLRKKMKKALKLLTGSGWGRKSRK